MVHYFLTPLVKGFSWWIDKTSLKTENQVLFFDRIYLLQVTTIEPQIKGHSSSNFDTVLLTPLIIQIKETAGEDFDIFANFDPNPTKSHLGDYHILQSASSSHFHALETSPFFSISHVNSERKIGC